jgi:ornithine carbamoyltransferase
VSKWNTKHFLTGAELSRTELMDLIQLAETLREQRKADIIREDLKGRTVVLLFEKPSLRTRVSFAVAVSELGGNCIVLDSIGRKKEDPEDTIRVLEGYCHAVMVRTHEHSILESMVKKSSIPVINGLSDTHHPCQVLADLQTLQQKFGHLKGLKLAYVGDGNNMLHSMLMLMPYLGIEVSYACPSGYEPSSFVVRQAKMRAIEGGGKVNAFVNPVDAVKNADAVYTDVWTSMGFEVEETDRDSVFQEYQLNEKLYSYAKDTAIIMHCMPMIKEKEITEGMAEHKNSVLFMQAENRMHAQKALLVGLIGRSQGAPS